MSRFSFLDIIGRPEKNNKADYQTAVFAPILTRDDIEIALFAGSVSGTVFMFAVSQSDGDPVRAFFAAATVYGVVSSVVYGGRVLSRSLPEAGQAVVEFAHTIQQIRPRLVPNEPSLGDYNRMGRADPRVQDVSVGRQDDWRRELRRFILAGQWSNSFSIHKLAASRKDEHGNPVLPAYVTDTGWRIFVKVLRDNNIFAKHGTARYADGVTTPKAKAMLKHDLLRLPIDQRGEIKPPPEVRLSSAPIHPAYPR